MPYNPHIHHRRSIRLQGYDYSQAGLYFITICCKDREHAFGEINNGKMILNDAGKIANEYLKSIPDKYDQTRLHEYIVMPNHVHFVVEIITGAAGAIHAGAIHAGAIHESPLLHESPLPLRDQRRKMLLSKIVGWYKMNTAKHINILCHNEGYPFWQRNYYEIIIRDEQYYERISNYIINNPWKWRLVGAIHESPKLDPGSSKMNLGDSSKMDLGDSSKMDLGDSAKMDLGDSSKMDLGDSSLGDS